MISTGALIASLAASGIAAGASAYKRKQAQDEETRNYQNAKAYLNSMYYRDPLTTVGNRSLLKAMKDSHKESLDAINNKMTAGGATVENQLAAMKANNANMDRAYTQLLKGEDARRDRIDAQRMALDNQHSAAVQSGYLQAAQDWQNWGAQAASAALSYGSSSLLGGAAGAAGGVEGDVLGAMAKRVDNADLMTPIIGGAPNVSTPGVTGPAMGGLKGVKR